MEEQIELLIKMYKHEGLKFGLANKSLTFWIVYRIMDYFYTLTINGNATRTVIYYCRFLHNSSLSNGGISSLINTFENNDINLTNDTKRIIYDNKLLSNLNVDSVIGILKMCEFTNIGGKKKQNVL
jgi:hypothetical protein